MDLVRKLNTFEEVWLYCYFVPVCCFLMAAYPDYDVEIVIAGKTIKVWETVRSMLFVYGWYIISTST